LANNKKKISIFIIFSFLFFNSSSQSLTNNVIATINNDIITELDIKNEIDFIKFINKSIIDINSEKLKREIAEILIDRKIKQIEINNAKIEISEKESEGQIYIYLENNKINNEILDNFFKNNQIESDYLKNIISIDIKWNKLIRLIYENKININLTEVNEQVKKESQNNEDIEKIKNQIIALEKNKILNKFSATHLDKSKKKYLIKFL
jgi:hypothetical protein